MNVGSLFSGIGGFDLGLERAGMHTVWFCEYDEFCQRVLARHWPNVPCHPDIRRLSNPEPVDVLCGGFPCQDLSYAGKGAGLAGARSGLWAEYARLIGELRPRYVVVENVSALLARGLWRVLGDLSSLGYDAEWDCIPASAVGAPHQRDRVWLVAYPNGQSQPGVSVDAQPGRRFVVPGGALADSSYERHERPWPARYGWLGPENSGGRVVSDWWGTEPDVGRVAHGVPARVDRLRALGNALVPQIAEWIGRRIMSYEEGE